MSRLLFTSLSTAVLLAFAPGARAADDNPKDIIAKAIKAHGGEESLTKHKAAQLKSKGKIDIPGVGEVDFTQEAAYMLPDKFKDVMELKVGGNTITVITLINGDKVSIEAGGMEVKLDDKVKDAVKDTGHMIEIARLVTLKDKKYELNIIGEDKVEGKKVVGVRVSAKGHNDVSVYFDKETGLLAKVEHRTVDPASGNEINEERIVGGYEKNKDGVPVAKKVLIKRDGKKFLEAEVTEMKYFEKLDDSEFKK
jgi:hypothetical protein